MVVELILLAIGIVPLSTIADPSRGFSGLMSVFERDGSRFRTRQTVLYETFNDQRFVADKPRNGLRLFCLGGSSAYGFPWGADVAFTALVGDALAASHPQRTVEAVNVAGISYAMHRLQIVAAEVMEHDPDVLLIYSGHNEFVERSFFRDLEGRSPGLERIEHVLSHSRLYSLWHRAWWNEVDAPRGNGPELFVRREDRVYPPEEKAKIVERFTEGLRRIVRVAVARNVRVVVATVPCNLRHWRPQKSVSDAALDAMQQVRWGNALQSGRAHLEAGRPREAVSELETAAALAPQHAEARYLLGQAYEAIGDWDHARAAFAAACDADASPVRRLSAMNDAIRMVAAEHEILLVDMDRVFSEESEHGIVGFPLIEDYVHPSIAGHRLIAFHIWRAIEQVLSNDPGALTRERFDRIVPAQRSRTLPVSPAWLFNTGCVLENQGRVPEAMAKYREALSIDPGAAGPLWNLSNLLWRSGETQAARGLLERLVERDAGHLRGRILMGNVLHASGHLQEAERSFRAALALDAESPEAHYELGRLQQSTGDLQGAIESYTRALRCDPLLAEAEFARGTALETSGDMAGAERSWRESLRLNPADRGSAYRLGRLLARDGRIEDAVEQYEIVVARQSGIPEAHYELAELHRVAGRHDAAVAQCREAIQARQGWPAPMVSLAWLLTGHPDAAQRDHVEALRWARRAAELTDQANPLALEVVAVALAGTGDVERALETAREAVRLAEEGDAPDIARRIRDRFRGISGVGTMP
ncbi:MAG: hypothetical protein CMJ18_03190 [Phycisphaeraceae bacterium]|nr:hypothetical protein [Phycisphaeraceae bacterium]